MSTSTLEREPVTRRSLRRKGRNWTKYREAIMLVVIVAAVILTVALAGGPVTVDGVMK